MKNVFIIRHKPTGRFVSKSGDLTDKIQSAQTYKHKGNIAYRLRDLNRNHQNLVVRSRSQGNCAWWLNRYPPIEEYEVVEFELTEKCTKTVGEFVPEISTPLEKLVGRINKNG